MRVAVKFAYDGRLFHGFARQPQLTTVEGELIKSLIKHGFIEDTVDAGFRAASRTDKGVSALGNVVAFNTHASTERVLNELNNDLPSILVYGGKQVDAKFYPRHAKLRMYRYYLKKSELDLDNVLSATALFAGKHDFTNFARVEDDKEPVRTVDNIVVAEHGDWYMVDFYAQTFLWNQIRRIVSAVEQVARETLTKEEVIAALENPGKPVDYGLAPAEPLILKDIVYSFRFDCDKNMANKLEELENKLVASMFKKG